jgi:hypothetical protein
MPVANGGTTLSELDGDTIAALLNATEITGDRPLSSVEIRTLGPVAQHPPATPDAVGGRSAAHLLNVYATPLPSLSDDARLSAARSVLDAVERWRAPVNLVNFVGRANPDDAIIHSWTAEQNAHINAVRAQHDPGEQFPYPTRHVTRR